MARLRTRPILLFGFIVVFIILFSFSNFHNSTNSITSSPSSTKKKFKTESDKHNDKIEAMMVKNMLKADEKQRNQLTDEEFKKLPIPEEVIKIAHGPVVTKNPEIKLTVLQKFSQLLKTWECSGQLPAIKETLLLIGRKGSGLDQVAKTLHYKFGVFVLYENLDQVTNAKEILYSLTNLSNCVIINHGDNLHANMEKSALKFNSLLLEACDDKCLTSPSLWTQLCQYFNGKALAFDNVKLADIKDAINESDAKAIYIYRDPRAILNPKSSDLENEASVLCENLKNDLHEIDNNMPKKQFHTLRFEDFALRPEEVISGQVTNLSKFCQHNNNQTSGHEFRSQVDAWKLKFSMEQIVMIEDKCAQVLNRLEYPIYGNML